MGRRPCCAKQGVNKGAWSNDKDRILTDCVALHGEDKWRKFPQNAGIKRGDISSDEEDLIIKLHRLLGDRWALIAARLPGRCDDEIKNYWNTVLVKKLQATRSNIKRHLNYEEKVGSFSGNGLVWNQQVNSHQKVLNVTEFSTSNEVDKDLVNTINTGAKNSFPDTGNLDPFRAEDNDKNDMSFLLAGDEDLVSGFSESNHEKMEMEDDKDFIGGSNGSTPCLEVSAPSCSRDEDKVETLTTNNHGSCDQPTLHMELKKLAVFLELED